MPQTAPRRDSNALRASVFDVFMELGALDANSKVASMILGETPEEDEDEEQDGARTPRGSSDGAFTPGGSKYRERFDSFILPDFEPERPSRDKERGFKGLAGRSRSRRRKDKHEPAEDSPTTHKRSIWHGFKRSKSNTRDKAKAERGSEDSLAPPPLPSSRSQSAAANYAGDGAAPPPTPTVTFPTLDRSDARSFATSAWVDVSADSRSVVAVPASEHQEYNPFLTGAPSSHLAAQPNLMRSVVGSMRRAISRPEMPSSELRVDGQHQHHRDPSDAPTMATFATGNWVDVAEDARSVVAVPASMVHEYNPFMAGAPASELPQAPTLMRSVSDTVGVGARTMTNVVRRAYSRPEAPPQELRSAFPSHGNHLSPVSIVSV